MVQLLLICLVTVISDLRLLNVYYRQRFLKTFSALSYGGQFYTIISSSYNNSVYKRFERNIYYKFTFRSNTKLYHNTTLRVSQVELEIIE